MNQLEVAVRCSALTKRYGRRLALDRLDLTVNDGEIVGLLGANGAGKTTILRLLLGLIRPDAGSAALLGRPVPSPRALAQVGAMVEEPAFYPWLDGRTNLVVLLDAGRHVHGSSIDAAIDLVDLNDAADHPVRTYSQGMRQRLGLALALARRPRCSTATRSHSRSTSVSR